jgi:pyrimidine-specific ribonucleoside hydrolase
VSDIEGDTHVERKQVPLVVDTDLGGDPDDAIALVVAAGLPELALVVTSDEHEGRRARLARHLLDLLGRTDVPVVAGRDLGNTRDWAAEGLVPDSVPAQPDDMLTAVEQLSSVSSGLRWLTLGPASNLADVLQAQPELAERMSLTLMCGTLEYRDPERAAHNIRLDVSAARDVLTAIRNPWLLPADVTITAANEVTPDSPEYALISRPGAPAWATLVTAHLDQWFARFQPGTMLHDALALALCMRRPFIDVVARRIELDDSGRMTASDTGWPVSFTRSADYAGFRLWLRSRLERALDRETMSSLG